MTINLMRVIALLLAALYMPLRGNAAPPLVIK